MYNKPQRNTCAKTKMQKDKYKYSSSSLKVHIKLSINHKKITKECLVYLDVKKIILTDFTFMKT